MKIQERIPKLVIKPNEIDGQDVFGLNLSLNDNTVKCTDCGSHLFYIKIHWGIVAENDDYSILGNKSNRTYCLREVGMHLYCAECGVFEEMYHKWYYPEDKIIMTFEEVEMAEKCEVEYCLRQWDQKGDFKPQYNWSELISLKEKLKEYEKKHPIKLDKKPIKKKQKKRKPERKKIKVSGSFKKLK